MQRGRTGGCVEVPALLRHEVTHFADVDLRVLRRKRDDGGGRVAEDVQLRQLRLDAPRDLLRSGHDGAARLEIATVNKEGKQRNLDEPRLIHDREADCALCSHVLQRSPRSGYQRTRPKNHMLKCQSSSTRRRAAMLIELTASQRWLGWRTRLPSRTGSRSTGAHGAPRCGT